MQVDVQRLRLLPGLFRPMSQEGDDMATVTNVWSGGTFGARLRITPHTFQPPENEQRWDIHDAGFKWWHSGVATRSELIAMANAILEHLQQP